MTQTETQKTMIYKHLQRFGSISPREAQEEYRVMRLASRILELKKDGVSIDVELKRNPITKKVYARYSLVK